MNIDLLSTREDVADVLVRCLGTKEATGKTFEVQSLPSFEKVMWWLGRPHEEDEERSYEPHSQRI